MTGPIPAAHAGSDFRTQVNWLLSQTMPAHVLVLHLAVLTWHGNQWPPPVQLFVMGQAAGLTADQAAGAVAWLDTHPQAPA